MIIVVLGKIEQNTCLRFNRIYSSTSELLRDFIAFKVTNDDEICGYTYVGKCVTDIEDGCIETRTRRYENIVAISHDCFGDQSTVFHEIFHKLGLWHEQSRYDRDSYVKIINKNIKPG